MGDDSLTCPYPDCVLSEHHYGLTPHQFPWGDSIPWPPFADLEVYDG